MEAATLEKKKLGTKDEMRVGELQAQDGGGERRASQYLVVKPRCWP